MTVLKYFSTLGTHEKNHWHQEKWSQMLLLHLESLIGLSVKKNFCIYQPLAYWERPMPLIIWNVKVYNPLLDLQFSFQNVGNMHYMYDENALYSIVLSCKVLWTFSPTKLKVTKGVNMPYFQLTLYNKQCTHISINMYIVQNPFWSECIVDLLHCVHS